MDWTMVGLLTPMHPASRSWVQGCTESSATSMPTHQGSIPCARRASSRSARSRRETWSSRKPTRSVTAAGSASTSSGMIGRSSWFSRRCPSRLSGAVSVASAPRSDAFIWSRAVRPASVRHRA